MRVSKFARFAIGITAFLANTIPANSQGTKFFVIADPELVLDVARGYGSATLETENDGDPRISGKLEGSAYAIVFYDCKQNRNCGSIQFVAGFDMKDGTTLEKINGWNQKKRFVQAHADSDGDPWIEMDFNFKGGATRASLDEAAGLWARLFNEFRVHIGLKQ